MTASKTSRIEVTPETVIAAYEKTKLRPVHHGYGDGETCGCPLSALFMQCYPGHDAADFRANSGIFFIAPKLGLNLEWAEGFVWGFDTGQFGATLDSYDMGRSVGAKTRAAVEEYAARHDIEFLEEH